MVLLVGVGVETFELRAVVVALLAEEEIVAIFAHPTLLQDLSFAAETLVAFVLLDLRLENCL